MSSKQPTKQAHVVETRIHRKLAHFGGGRVAPVLGSVRALPPESSGNNQKPSRKVTNFPTMPSPVGSANLSCAIRMLHLAPDCGCVRHKGCRKMCLI